MYFVQQTCSATIERNVDVSETEFASILTKITDLASKIRVIKIDDSVRNEKSKSEDYLKMADKAASDLEQLTASLNHTMKDYKSQTGTLHNLDLTLVDMSKISARTENLLLDVI